LRRLAADPHSKSKAKPTGSNAQPITEAVRKMIKDPSLEPRVAALQIADTNKEECRKVSKDGLCGANTIGVYDESKAPGFSRPTG